MAVPEKYKHMNTFHEYVTGVKVAPVLTVFIGGNHEASNILQSLYYGGFVAPNIYFLGFAGVVNFGHLRITGVSGICNDSHYRHSHYEKPPYNSSTLRSVYHIRELEIYLGTGSMPSNCRVNAVLSHDWPRHIWKYGDCAALLHKKPGLAEDIHSSALGGACLWDLLCELQPEFWFCAHHHVKFPALSAAERVSTSEAPEIAPSRVTRFLALDKVLPGRKFLQVLTIPCPDGFIPESANTKLTLQYDLEWLSILQRTHEYLEERKHRLVTIPANLQPEATEAELRALRCRIITHYGSLDIPNIDSHPIIENDSRSTEHQGNAQTDSLLEVLGLPHVWTVPQSSRTNVTACSIPPDENEINI
eukprot:GSChrysophyteH1.ASY1.ANO1.1462.1 assembled CDS